MFRQGVVHAVKAVRVHAFTESQVSVLTSAAWRQRGISSGAALSPISSSGVCMHVITINQYNDVILLYRQ